jgi:putative membrane protein
MKKALLYWILSALAVWIVSQIVPGFTVDGAMSALIAAVVIGLISCTLGTVLKLVTFPFAILTLGLFWLVINALMLMLASYLLPGFQVDGFISAFIGSIVLSLVNMVMRAIAD